MTALYIARHARPELPDDEKRFLGQSNLPLGRAGLEQAQALSDRLHWVRFDAIYSSDLARCRSTAEIVAEGASVAVTVDPRLREIDTGLWEGLTPEQAHRAYPREFAEREDDVIGYPFPGGESFRALRVRVLAVLDEILARRHEVALIVAHLGVNRLMLAHLKGLPLEGMFSLRQDYCDFEVVAVPEGS